MHLKCFTTHNPGLSLIYKASCRQPNPPKCFARGDFQLCSYCGKILTDTNRNDMMTSSNGNIFRVTGSLWHPLIRLVTRSFDVFFDLRLNKRLNKQSRRRWFETESRSFWHHCNVHVIQCGSTIGWYLSRLGRECQGQRGPLHKGNIKSGIFERPTLPFFSNQYCVTK